MRLEAIASRLEAIAIRFEAIAIRLEDECERPLKPSHLGIDSFWDAWIRG